jgi:hypothetical protein
MPEHACLTDPGQALVGVDDHVGEVAPGCRSLVVRALGTYGLVTGETPEPGPGEVAVQVTAAGLCGSDRELVEGTASSPRRSGRARRQTIDTEVDLTERRSGR